MLKNAILVGIAFAAAACGDGTNGGADAGALCTPGQVVACTCPGGSRSQSICSNDRAFGACACNIDAGGANADGVGRDGSGGGGDAAAMSGIAKPDGATDVTMRVDAVDAQAAASSACMTIGKLSGGTQRLLGLFAVSGGFIVARTDAVELVQHDRTVKKLWSPPRPLTSVSFDGTWLAVADAAKVNVLDASLAFQGDVTLIESCASSVIVGNGIFVCGPSNDWDRIFYTYDLAKRVLVNRSAKYTYKGIPMRRVPGSNNFVTVTDGLSPSDFHMYQVDPATGITTFLKDSPYHGDFSVTTVYGFDGVPPAHLVNMDGLLLKISPEGCVAGNSYPSGCFVKDGTLGTLRQGETFASLTNTADGRLFGIVSSTVNGSFYDPPCKNGCSLQQIDVAQRRVVSERKQTSPLGRVITMAVDPVCGVALVGYQLASASSFDYAGYQVDVLEL